MPIPANAPTLAQLLAVYGVWESNKHIGRIVSEFASRYGVTEQEAVKWLGPQYIEGRGTLAKPWKLSPEGRIMAEQQQQTQQQQQSQAAKPKVSAAELKAGLEKALATIESLSAATVAAKQDAAALLAAQSSQPATSSGPNAMSWWPWALAIGAAVWIWRSK